MHAATPPVQAEPTSRPPGAHVPAAAGGNRYPAGAALPNPQKTTEAALYSKKRPCQRTAVNHITPQPAARRGKSKNCGGVHFKVGKGTGMIRQRQGEQHKEQKQRCGASHMPVMQYVMLNIKHGRNPRRERR